MLTGRVPYDGENPVAVAMQHLHAQPVPIQSIAPDVPPAVIRVCMKAIEKNPSMRYQSARDMAADLRAALDERGGRRNGSSQPTDVRQPRPQIRDSETGRKRRRGNEEADRKNRLTWSIASVILALAIGVGLYFGINRLINRYTTTVIIPDIV